MMLLGWRETADAAARAVWMSHDFSQNDDLFTAK
jgi:hypothetical protein